MPDRNTDEPRMMCAVCRHRLSDQVDADGNFVKWAHGTGSTDHEPRPVPEVEDSVILCCDFCLREHPTWDMPARPTDHGTPISLDTMMMSVSDWAACTECKDLIVADDYNGLADRAVAGHILKQPELAEVAEKAPSMMVMARIHMREQMEEFRRCRDGDPIPIEHAIWLASRLREVTGELS